MINLDELMLHIPLQESHKYFVAFHEGLHFKHYHFQMKVLQAQKENGLMLLVVIHIPSFSI